MGLYCTPNLHLACTLATLSVPLANRAGEIAQQGECPEWRAISPEQIEAAGCSTFEEAVEKGVVGTIVYGFTDHDDRKDVLKAYNAILHAKGTLPMQTLPDTVTIKDADGAAVEVKTVVLIAQFAALYAKNLEMLGRRRNKVTARFQAMNENGYPVGITAGASEKTKATFNL